jgi:hypothetical protein
MKNLNANSKFWVRGILGTNINLLSSANNYIFPVIQNVCRYFVDPSREVIVTEDKISFRDSKIRSSCVNINKINHQVKKHTIHEIIVTRKH